jgi:hypothetical protein
LHDRAHPPDAITTSATKISRLDPLVIALILSFLSDGLGCLAAKVAGDVIEPMGGLRLRDRRTRRFESESPYLTPNSIILGATLQVWHVSPDLARGRMAYAQCCTRRGSLVQAS